MASRVPVSTPNCVVVKMEMQALQQDKDTGYFDGFLPPNLTERVPAELVRRVGRLLRKRVRTKVAWPRHQWEYAKAQLKAWAISSIILGVVSMAAAAFLFYYSFSKYFDDTPVFGCVMGGAIYLLAQVLLAGGVLGLTNNRRLSWFCAGVFEPCCRRRIHADVNARGSAFVQLVRSNLDQEARFATETLLHQYGVHLVFRYDRYMSGISTRYRRTTAGALVSGVNALYSTVMWFEFHLGAPAPPLGTHQQQPQQPGAGQLWMRPQAQAMHYLATPPIAVAHGGHVGPVPAPGAPAYPYAPRTNDEALSPNDIAVKGLANQPHAVASPTAPPPAVDAGEWAEFQRFQQWKASQQAAAPQDGTGGASRPSVPAGQVEVPMVATALGTGGLPPNDALANNSSNLKSIN